MIVQVPMTNYHQDDNILSTTNNPTHQLPTETINTSTFDLKIQPRHCGVNRKVTTNMPKIEKVKLSLLK